MTTSTKQQDLLETCAALRSFVAEHPYDEELPPLELLAHRIRQSVRLTRAALRELDRDGDIALVGRKPALRLRPGEAHPKDDSLVREIRDGIGSGLYRSGQPLPVGLLAQRHRLGARRMARVCRPLLADGLLVNRAEAGGARLYVADRTPAPSTGPGRIEDYGLLSDQRGSALVRRDGSIDWLCLPRFDSDAVFARLLGTSEHGFWHLAPASLMDGTAVPGSFRRYAGDTMVLETRWKTSTGEAVVADFMVPGGGSPRLVRVVTGLAGHVSMRSLLRARPGYGHAMPRISPFDRRHAIDLDEDGGARLWLDADAPVRLDGADLVADFTVAEHEQVSFTLSWREGVDSPPPPTAGDALLKFTLEFWEAWAGRCTYSGPDREAIVRSLLTLAALIYVPTGATVAAPTTSLPEEIGGVRNYDYRYNWLRDGALTIGALASHGYLREAHAWISWMVAACAGAGRRQVMYGVGGETELPERELAWLPGYEGSAPVRIGNGAASQLQVDIYGELAQVLCKVALADTSWARRIGALVVALVEELEEVWDRPDAGIWEMRGPQRHFTHSRVMAWTAVDCAVQLIEAGHANGPLERWRSLRATIHAEVCEKGYDAERNTFTQSYGSPDLDASLLHAMLSGFLPADDKRVIGTIEAVQRELGTDDGFLLRYRTTGSEVGPDGFPGDEGRFLICTRWLAECLALIGRPAEARTVLDSLLAVRNGLGLLAEEYDPGAGRQLGNFPQAFSHIAHADATTSLNTATTGDAAAPCPTGAKP
ncbi:glycoside hydrolase family 15 protein [Streptomyces sp. NPDC054835]|uniref:glycoside hydrolase family 15 protein n=1 Tax=Streptomyces exfoliatus TaxID=1905 RepID=UPI0004671A73|nr:glycoside hydrolase family 15 protein [Streptomyces exfoliatus]